MKFVRCGIHGFHETLGIDLDELRFHWTLHTDDEHEAQTHYRIIVKEFAATSIAEPQHNDKVVWDSGKIKSPQQRNVLCKPVDGFASTAFHYWTVIVWTAEEEFVESVSNTFFTSYPRSSRLLPPWSMNQKYMPHSSLIFRTWFEDEPNRWKAVWIGDGGDKPIYLRRAFSLDKKVSKAIVLASGLGHFNLTVNGQPGSNHLLDPGWTNYHRTVQFVGYDITPHVREGQNVIGSHVGNGFYAGDQGDRFFWPMYEDNTYVRYGNELCFFAEVHVFYADGNHEVIVSDPSWTVRKSATTLANIYASEDHNRTTYPDGWDTPGFDDSQWSSAKPLTGPRGKLSYQRQPPVTLQEEFAPKLTRVIRPGVVCFDLGQNSSINVELQLEGIKGSEVIVRYSETVAEDGTVLMPDPLFKEFEQKVYCKITLAGTGEPEVWCPDFSFTSARYIQVEGVSLDSDTDLPIVRKVTGRHISSASRRLGSIKTDKDDVNGLINACYWSFASNLFSYHTDCPQIEKFGWLEVTHLLAPATQYIRDMEALYTKILDDILDTQEPNGLVPTMAPEIRYMCGPLHDTITWGCAICFLPDILKRYYGSTHVIPKVYPACVRYMEYMSTKERKGGLIEHGLGDWGRDTAFGNLQANIETAVYYRCLQNVEMMAREQGLELEAERFRSWAARIYDCYNKHLLVVDDGSQSHIRAFYTSLDNYPKRDLQTIAQAIALQFNMVPSKHKNDVIASFIESCSDCRIRSGEIGLKYLWNTLADANRPDIVLAMARQEEHPSYMRFLRRGETTLLEFWQDECRSKCHDMLGTIYEWFYEAVLGVRPTTDAYRTWDLRPPYGSEFNYVEGSVDCPYGLIEVKFDRRDRSVLAAVVTVTVPTSTTAKMLLPGDGARAEIMRKEIDGSEKARSESGESVVLRQGTYRISILL